MLRKDVVLELYGREPKVLFHMGQTVHILTPITQRDNDYKAAEQELLSQNNGVLIKVVLYESKIK